MRYDLRQAAALLGTGRTTLCRTLRDRQIFNAQNMPARQHVCAGRFIVKLKAREAVALGKELPYAQTLVTDKGILWLASELGIEITREAANDDNGNQ